MSKATARPNSPDASTSAVQSLEEPGLPWTKTIASRASCGPASMTGEPIPPTLILLVRGISADRRGRGGLHARSSLRSQSRGALAATQVDPNHPREHTRRQQLLRCDPAAAHQGHLDGEVLIARRGAKQQLFAGIESLAGGVSRAEFLVRLQAFAVARGVARERRVDRGLAAAECGADGI